MTTLIILPYFGKFNSYFKLWLLSCENNSDFDWLIITDVQIEEKIPKNVKVINMSFDEFKSKLQKKFDFKIRLNKPYKLCDYKQFYGYIFEDDLRNYDYWGYCDCDLIFGNIRNFISQTIQNDYDKLLRTGHLSLIRNDMKLNKNFKKYGTQRISLTSSVIYGYDESINGYHLGFAGELIESGYKFFDCSEWIGDVDFRYYPFYEINAKKQPCVYEYDNGKLYRIIRKKDILIKEERMYVHLQKRNMQMNIKKDFSHFLICPNEFIDFDHNTLNDEYFWNSISDNRNNYYNFRREKIQNLKRDIYRLLHEPNKIDSLLYRFRGRKK